MSANPFPEHLRAEYDPQLFDIAARGHKARQLQSALQQAKLWQSPQRILDVGCGTGLILANLTAGGAQRVGCDIRREPFEMGGGTSSIEFVQADCAAIPLPSATFDIILCLAVVGEFPDWKCALSEMARCVAPEGCLYLTVANSPNLLRRYAIQEKIGYAIPPAWWSYARACLPFFEYSPAQGFGLSALQTWDFVNMTPYLGRAAYPALRALPSRIAATLLEAVAPSLAYAWRRPIS